LVNKYLLLSILIIAVLGLALGGCGNSGGQPVTFSQLISQADRYNGKIVTLEAFYFSGFEISALCESVGPATSGPSRIVPTGTLIWVAGGIPLDLQNTLYGQGGGASGYTERVGKLKIKGKFETGKFGHLDSYQYRITISEAEALDWSPP
jgi:hypothetical protein